MDEPLPQDIPPGEIPGLLEDWTLYGYTPTRWICGLFVALYSITTIIHLAQAIRFRGWWLIPTACTCGLTEVIGWAGRLWSSYNAQLLDPYLMQICCTILAPSFLTAANFTILGIIIRRLGHHYSRLSPRLYLIIFISLDLVALVVQAIGGGKASIAAQTGNDPEPGGRIMEYGIIVQMIAMSIYCLCAAEFLLRYHFDKPVGKPKVDSSGTGAPIVTTRKHLDKGTKLMVLGMAITTVFLYIRCIYRTIELQAGWSGPIITNQDLFNILDGMPIVVAMFTMNVFHPGFLLKDDVSTLGRRPKKAVDDTEAVGQATPVNNETKDEEKTVTVT